MNQPIISVIIPCYNYDAYLPDACDSLLRQSFPNWECILVNNGAFPKTAAVAKSYVNRDSRFKYLETSNSGPSAARNEGLQMAQGEFIQFLDADDRLADNRFSVLRDAFLKNPTLDILYTNVKYFTTEQANQLKDSLNNLNSAGKSGHQGSGRELYNILLRQNIFVINSPLVKRKLVSESGGFNISFNHLEDWEFWLRISSGVREFAFLPDGNAIALVRSHSDSLSRDTHGMELNYLPILLTNLRWSRISILSLIRLYIRASEVIIDGILKGRFLQTFSLLISSSNRLENYLTLAIHYLLLPVYLPLYLIIKLYRVLSGK